MEKKLKLVRWLGYLDPSDPMNYLEGPNPNMTGDTSWIQGDCTDIRGDCSQIEGDVSGLSGDVTGIIGDCTGLEGDLDECAITPAERYIGVEIADLVADD